MISRALISNLAWLEKSDLSDVEIFLLKKKLTIIPEVTSYDDEEVKPVAMYRETDTRLGIPKHFWQENYHGPLVEEKFDISNGHPITPNKSKITLRPEDQEPEVSEFLRQITRGPWGGGIFRAYTGYGKSISGIEMALRLGRTTLILVHKEPLKNMWAESIRQFYPNCKLGFIQGDECDYRGKDIVIAMVQTLFSESREWPFDLFSYFGTVIVDEVHRFGANKFGSVAPKFNCKHIIGLSGTVRRKDGCENVFYWVVGQILVTAIEENRLKPIIYVRETGFKPVKTPQFDMDDFQKPTLMNFLARSKARNHLVAVDVIKALKAGRNPLVMAERLEMLDNIAKFVYELGQKELGRSITNGMFIGGKTEEEQKKAASCEVVYATTQLVQEGVNIPRLDTLMLATPISDPEQAIGRICRNLPGKKTPMVVDYFDSKLSKLVGLFHSRIRLYKKLGWQIIGFKL